MLRFVILIAVCGMLTGCMLFPSLDVVMVEPLTTVPRPTVTPEELAALPPGAKVEVLWELGDSKTRTIGEVLHTSPQGVALMNVHREVEQRMAAPVLSKLPYTGHRYKNTAVGMVDLPVHWVAIFQMTTTRVLSPPPEGYVAPQLPIKAIAGDGVERIGIDFDFNTGETFESPVVTESTR